MAARCSARDVLEDLLGPTGSTASASKAVRPGSLNQTVEAGRGQLQNMMMASNQFFQELVAFRGDRVTGSEPLVELPDLLARRRQQPGRHRPMGVTAGPAPARARIDADSDWVGVDRERSGSVRLRLPRIASVVATDGRDTGASEALAVSPPDSPTQLFDSFELRSLPEPPVGIEPTTCSLRVPPHRIPACSAERICPARSVYKYSSERCRFSGNCYENCYEGLHPGFGGGCDMNHDLAASMAESAELMALHIGQWQHLEYPENVPPLGQRNADAIVAGHAAICTIDRMIRSLCELRVQLTAELQEDEDIRASASTA